MRMIYWVKERIPTGISIPFTKGKVKLGFMTVYFLLLYTNKHFKSATKVMLDLTY